MSSALRTVFVCAAIATALPACASGPKTVGVAPPVRIPKTETLSEKPVGEPVAITALSKALRRAVVAEAAKRFGVAESGIVLASAERVTWSDGSLGCPEPGMMYTQSLVPGFRIVARAAAGLLIYHATEGTEGGASGPPRVVTCAQMSMQPGAPER